MWGSLNLLDCSLLGSLVARFRSSESSGPSVSAVSSPDSGVAATLGSAAPHGTSDSAFFTGRSTGRVSRLAGW